MKPIKGWAIVSAEGLHADYIYKDRASAIKDKLIGKNEWVVRVEIRAVVKGKKRTAAGLRLP